MKTIIKTLLVCLPLALWQVEAEAVEDAEIKEAVVTHLKDYAPTSSVDLAVEVKDGIVSLSGNAENLPVKKLAADAASQVRGVRAVVNRLKVREIEREDEIVDYDLKRLFTLNYPEEKTPIKVTVNDGVVTLKGTVSTYELKLLSSTMAESVIGVRDVVNLLRVEPLTPSNDEEISQHIALLLKGDAWIDDDLVMISVEDGIVDLNGAVDSMSEKARLESAVSVYGIRGVESDNLKVSPELRPKMQRAHEPAFVTDEEIGMALRNALETDPRVFAENIEITVLDNDVTLIGSVASIGAKAAIEADAKNVPGVDLVYSYLMVEPENEVGDEALEKALDAVVDADALLAGAEIEPRVEDHVVTLEGEVLSKFQRRRAIRTAANAIGVKKVISKLRVDWKTPDGYKGESTN